MGKRKNKKNKDRIPPSNVKSTPDRPDFLQEMGLGALVLVVAAFVVYFPALDCGFIWDDPQYVIENQHLRSFSGLMDIWFGLSRTHEGIFGLKSATPQYYPLVFTSFWMEYQLWDLKPFGYHLNNIVLHILSAILLWRLLRRLAVPGAWIAAALFLLHPVQVESVVWITERKNVLSLVFYLCAFHLYLSFDALRARSSENRSEDYPPGSMRRYYLFTLILFLCALLSKTVTSTLPAVLLLVMWWKKERITWPDLKPLLPLFAMGILFGLMTAMLEASHVGAKGDEWSLGFGERCLLAGRIPWFYAWKLIWPVELIFFYPRWEIDAGVWWQYIFPLALIAVPCGLWMLRRRIGIGPLVCVLIFIGSLVPALGFFNVYPMRFSYVADHFQYMAGIGFIVLIAAAAVHFVARGPKSWKLPSVAVCAVVLCLLGWRSAGQIPAYRDRSALWHDTLSKNPDSWIAYNNLGEILFAEARVTASGQDNVQDQAKLRQAMNYTLEALKRKNDLPEAHGNLANAYFGFGNYEKAVEHYKELLSLNPSGDAFRTAQHNLSITYDKLGKIDEAADCCRTLIARGATDLKTHSLLAGYLVKLQKYEEAIPHYKLLVSRQPDDVDLNNNLGTLLQALGKNKEAAEYLRIALKNARMAGRNDVVMDIERRLREMK
ncbi:MAG: tetratricopeptide repeat protein [Planctomycetota bacterium]